MSRKRLSRLIAPLLEQKLETDAERRVITRRIQDIQRKFKQQHSLERR